jgi:hypothetical protein
MGIAVVIDEGGTAAGGLKTLTLIGNHPPKLRTTGGIAHRNLLGGIKAIAMLGGVH